jgi:hypothetical protein
MAERQGFEPWDTISDVTHFPGVRLQPLGHLSKTNKAHKRNQTAANKSTELKNVPASITSIKKAGQPLGHLSKNLSETLGASEDHDAPTGRRAAECPISGISKLEILQKIDKYSFKAPKAKK